MLKAKSNYTKSKDILSIDDSNFMEPAATHDFNEQIISKHLEMNLNLYKTKVYSRLKDKEITLAEYICQKKKYAEIAKLMNTSEAAVSMASVRLYRKVRQIVADVIAEIF